MLVYYFVLFIVSNRYLLFWVSNGHNSVTVQNRTHVYMHLFHHKDLGNHLLQYALKSWNTLYVMGPIHDNFITWWQVYILIIWQPDKIFMDMRNNKGNRVLSLISKESLLSGVDQKCYWNLCLHTVHHSTWISYQIQQCHCSIPPPAHTCCWGNHQL